MALLGGGECHPQLQGDFPASDGSAHAAWQGQSGGNQLGTHEPEEPPDSSAWDLSLGAHL